MIVTANIPIAEYEGRKFIPFKDNSSYKVQFDTYKECEDWIKKEPIKGYAPELGYRLGLGEYHSSWEWLMPVIVKICTERFEDGDNSYVRTFGMRDEAGLYMFRFNRGILFHAPTIMEAAYAGVLDYVNWKLQQPKE